MSAPARDEAHEVLQRHARTFSAAAALLAPHTYDAIASIYLFCRTVDDLADDRPDPEALARISDELRGRREPSALVRRVLDLRALGVPIEAAAQLVEGCRTDLGRVRMADEAAVVRYGYLVAGTVGRMVSPLLGATDPRAEPFAVDLGIGMQLTNIARDVGEDAARDRIYLPATWLGQAGLSEDDVIAGGRDAEVAEVVARLLSLAERYYDSADAGLRYLPWRARVAVSLAARRYRGIGRRVRARGAAAVRERTVLGPASRLGYLALAPLVAIAKARAPRPSHERALHRPIADLMGPIEPGWA